MTSIRQQEQTQIKNWFDKTYQQRGFSYLRPLAAYEVYIKLLNLQPDETFLDVACGPGLMLQQALQVGAKAYGIDISEKAIEMAKSYVPAAQTQTANAEQLPFEDGSMDAITCLGSLERMINLEQVLGEIHRVGKENGRFCFLVRNSNTLTWKLFMEKLGLRNKEGHQGAKTLEAWHTYFEKNGFEIVKVIPDQWPFVRWGQIATLGLYTPNPTKIRQGLRPLSTAYEFIFLLRKSESG